VEKVFPLRLPKSYKPADGAMTVLMEAAGPRYEQRESGRGLARSVVDLLRGAWGPYCPPDAGNRDPEVLKLLLQKGADVNLRTADGWTALKRARGGGTSSIVQVLLAHGDKE
jgi:hypothetical protein